MARSVRISSLSIMVRLASGDTVETSRTGWAVGIVHGSGPGTEANRDVATIVNTLHSIPLGILQLTEPTGLCICRRYWGGMSAGGSRRSACYVFRLTQIPMPLSNAAERPWAVGTYNRTWYHVGRSPWPGSFDNRRLASGFPRPGRRDGSCRRHLYHPPPLAI